MVSANELDGRLRDERAKTLAEIRELEQDRGGLTLGAHTGDAAAKKRLGIIRTRLAERHTALKEIATALEDLEPRIRAERAEAARADRRRQAEYLERVLAAAARASHRVDVAVEELRKAMEPATQLVEEARRVAMELTLRDTGGDIGEMAIARMVALDTSVLRSLPELMLPRLAAVGVLPENSGGAGLVRVCGFAELVSQAADVLTVRVADVLARDAAEARAEAEPVPELEAVA